MLKIKWDSLAIVNKIKTPILFISGDQDTFVPTQMTIRLHDACGSAKKSLMIVPGGNHNNTFAVAGKDYIEKLKNFMKECLEETKDAWL